MASAAFFFLCHKEDISRGPAQAQEDLVCLRVGLSSIDSRGTLVAGPPPSSSSSRQCCDISNFPGAQGTLSKVDSNTLMIRKVQTEHVSETESECKTRSNFRALFYRVSRAFGCDQNVHVALVTRGARRSKRNLPYVLITHSYVLAFFPTRFLLHFRSHFCRNCSFTRRFQHDSVLELFPHFAGGLDGPGFSRVLIFAGTPRSAGEPCTCREKFGPRPIFKIFSLDQIRVHVDQEKKGGLI